MSEYKCGLPGCLDNKAHGHTMTDCLVVARSLAAKLAKADTLAEECDFLKLKNHLCAELSSGSPCVICDILKALAEYRKEP